MRQLKKFGLLVACLMVFGLAASTAEHQTRADDATPIAEEPATATPVATFVPTEAPTDVAPTVPTEAATATPTEIATALPTKTPAAKATSVPSATATKSVVNAQSVSTGSLKIAAVDAGGHALSQSCVQYAPMSTPNSLTTLCDSVPALSGTASDDGAPDGFIEIPNLIPGSWFLQGSDPLDSLSPAPLPVAGIVKSGQTTTVSIVFHAYGELDVKLKGAAGQALSPCAFLYLDNYPINGSSGVADKLATKCDADDGSRDGIVKFTNLPAGSYWAWPHSDESSPQYGDFGTAAVVTGQTATVVSYVPSAHLVVKVVDSVTGAQVPNMYINAIFWIDANHTGFDASGSTSGQPVSLLVVPSATYTISVRPDHAHDVFEPYDPAEADNVVVTSPGQTVNITIKVVNNSTPTPQPSMTISPNSAFVGDRLTVSVNNMPAQSTVTVKIDGRTVGSGKTGTATNLSLGVTIPALTEGAHTVTASSGAVSLSKTLTIKASQTVSATTVAAGKTVKLTVHGFRAKETVTIRLYGLNSTTKYLVLGTLTVDGSGSGSKTVTIPSTMSAGSHKLASYGKDTHAGNYVTVTVVHHQAQLAAQFVAGQSAWRRI